MHTDIFEKILERNITAISSKQIYVYLFSSSMSVKDDMQRSKKYSNTRVCL